MKRVPVLALSLSLAVSISGCGNKKFDVAAYCAQATSLTSLQTTLTEGSVATLAADVKAANISIKAVSDKAPEELKAPYNEIVLLLDKAQPKLDAIDPNSSSDRLTAMAGAFGADAAALQADLSKITAYNSKNCTKESK